MNRKFLLINLLALFFSCGGNKNEISVHERINLYEDSIAQWGGGLGSLEDRNQFADRYIKVLEKACIEDEKHANVSTYIDRIHMWYSTKGDTQNALKWATKLLEEYPKYPNREMLLESIASMYDTEIIPRDSTKVRAYYTQLLTEFPNLDQEKKVSIEERLKYNYLSFEEYIMKQIID